MNRCRHTDHSIASCDYRASYELVASWSLARRLNHKNENKLAKLNKNMNSWEDYSDGECEKYAMLADQIGMLHEEIVANDRKCRGKYEQQNKLHGLDI